MTSLNKHLLSLFGLAITTACQSQSNGPFSARLLVPGQPLLAGTPAHITIVIERAGEGYGMLYCHVASRNAGTATDNDGRPVNCDSFVLEHGISAVQIGHDSPNKTRDKLLCKAVGPVELTFTFSGCKDQRLDQPRPEGTKPILTEVPEFSTSKAVVVFTPPTGIDNEAYEAANGFPAYHSYRPMILDRYPTSYYAGYALAGSPKVINLMYRMEQKSLAQIVSGEYVKQHPMVEEDPLRVREERKPARTPISLAISKRRALITNYLKIHPEFEDRWALEYQAVLLHLAAGDYEAASRSFDWLNAHPEGRSTGELTNFAFIKTFMTERGLYRAKK